MYVLSKYVIFEIFIGKLIIDCRVWITTQIDRARHKTSWYLLDSHNTLAKMRMEYILYINILHVTLLCIYTDICTRDCSASLLYHIILCNVYVHARVYFERIIFHMGCSITTFRYLLPLLYQKRMKEIFHIKLIHKL